MNNFYILVILFVIPVIITYVISFIYSNNKKIELGRKISGFEVARKILDENDIKKMYIVEIKSGDLTDCYDSKQKVIRLSTDVFHGESTYAAAVAAYYAGLAVKDVKENNILCKMKLMLDIVVEFIYIVAGMAFVMWCFLQDSNIFMTCLVLFIVALLYDFLVIPLNMNNSKDSFELLKKIDNFSDIELDKEKVILNTVCWVQTTSAIILLCKWIKNLIANIKAG